MSRLPYVVLITLIIFQIPMYIGSNENSNWAELEISETTASENNLELLIEIKSQDYGANYAITSFSSNYEIKESQEEIRVIRDDSQSSSCYSMDSYGQARAWGMVDHLSSEISLRNSEIGFDHFTMDQFIQSGYLGHLFMPYDLESDSSHLENVSNWVVSGGILYTQGRFFHEMSREDRDFFLKISDSENLDIFSETLDNDIFNLEESNISRGLGLRFPQSRLGFSLDDLAILQGTDLGPASEGELRDRSSISLIPIGSGAIVHFGGCMWAKKWFDDEKTVSYDLLNIVQSGISGTLTRSNSYWDYRAVKSIDSETYYFERGEGRVISYERSLDEIPGRFLNIFIFNEAPIGHRGMIFQVLNPNFQGINYSDQRGPVTADELEFSAVDGELSISVKSINPGNLNIFISQTTTQPAYQKQIGFYYSPNLSPLCNQIQTITKFYQSFYSKMAESGISVVEISTEGELDDFLESGNIKSLVFATSNIPSQVFSQNNTTLTDWLKDGGSLYWLGELIGGFSSSDTTEPTTWDNPENLQWEGEVSLFGESRIKTKQESYDDTNSSIISSGLKIEFSSYSLSPLIDESSFDEGIYPLGDYYFGEDWIRSAVTYIEIGDGGVVLFGGCLGNDGSGNSPEKTASYLTRIILSGIVDLEEFWPNEYSALEFKTERFGFKTFEFAINEDTEFANVVIFNDEEVLHYESLAVG